MADSKSSRRRKYSSSSDSSVDSAENERRKDLLERDEFANRLRKKDESHTRKVVEVSFINHFTLMKYNNELNKIFFQRFQIKKVSRKQPNV